MLALVVLIGLLSIALLGRVFLVVPTAAAATSAVGLLLFYGGSTLCVVGDCLDAVVGLIACGLAVLPGSATAAEAALLGLFRLLSDDPLRRLLLRSVSHGPSLFAGAIRLHEDLS